MELSGLEPSGSEWPGVPAGWGEGGAGSPGGLVQALLGDVATLADPLAVALKVDLCGREGAAAQLHGLVLHDVGVLRLLQKWGSVSAGADGRSRGALPCPEANKACGEWSGSVRPQVGGPRVPSIPWGLQQREELGGDRGVGSWRRPARDARCDLGKAWYLWGLSFPTVPCFRLCILEPKSQLYDAM